jgi:hypothetical protein
MDHLDNPGGDGREGESWTDGWANDWPSRSQAPRCIYLFLFGACVSADAATDFIALEELGLASIFPAFEATDFDVRSLILFIAALQMENT